MNNVFPLFFLVAVFGHETLTEQILLLPHCVLVFYVFLCFVVIFGKQWNNSHNPTLQADNTYLKKRFLLVDKDEEDEIINTLSLYCLAVIRSVLGMLGVA